MFPTGFPEVLALKDDFDEFRAVLPRSGDRIALKNVLAQVSDLCFVIAFDLQTGS